MHGVRLLAKVPPTDMGTSRFVRNYNEPPQGTVAGRPEGSIDQLLTGGRDYCCMRRRLEEPVDTADPEVYRDW
jgi:hypothetical protein